MIDDKETRVAVTGELDHEAGPQLRRILVAAIVAGRTIRLDLSKVTFVDSEGIKALYDAADVALNYKVHLIVDHATRTVTRLLQAFGLDRLIDRD
ncbi:MAG: STAS domain-containing protein [Microthrixaceae bacterium]